MNQVKNELNRGAEREREKGGNRTLTLTSFLILDEKAFNSICLNKQNTEVNWRPWNCFHGHLPGIFLEAYVPQGGDCYCAPAINRVWMGQGDVVITSH